MQPKQMRDTRKSEFPSFTYSITQMTFIASKTQRYKNLLLFVLKKMKKCGGLVNRLCCFFDYLWSR